MRRYVSGAVFLLLLTSSHAAFAQEVVPRPNAVIPADATIFLLDDEGREHRGKFLRLDDRELIMVIDGQERTFGRNVITRIERAGDSLKNGAITGAIVGATLGLLRAFTVDSGDQGGGIAAVAISTGLYAAIGTGIDAANHGRTLVYDVSLFDPAAPVRQQGAVALAFSVRW